MNDDLFNYLVATDNLDEFLGYEPKCPICGNKLIKRDDNYYCENCKEEFIEEPEDE